jgi:hypothetical protein
MPPETTLCDYSAVHQSQQASSLREGRETDDESRLFDRVRASGRSVAVYDVSTPAILAVSQRAREQLGFVDVELAAVNIVDGARDPESTRKLIALIRDGQLTEWKVRSWLQTPDGGGFWEFARGHAIDVGGRRLGLVSYPSPVAPNSDAAGPPVNEDSIVGRDVGPPVERFPDNPAWKFPDNPAWNTFMDLVHSGRPDGLREYLAAPHATSATDDQPSHRVIEL